MIKYTILILAVLLVVLLVDWGKLLESIKIKKIEKAKKNGINDDQDLIKESESQDIFENNQPLVTGHEKFFTSLNNSKGGSTQTPSASKYNEDIEKMLSEADLHFKRGEMKLAEEIYLKVASKDPKCSKAYSRLGVIYLEVEGSLEDAKEAFCQALKVEPNNGYILNNLGLVLYHQDKYADAIRNFELAVRADEYNPARHANLGMAFLAVRQYAKAESSFKRALKLDPNEAEYKDLLNESIEKKQAHKALIRR